MPAKLGAIGWQWADTVKHAGDEAPQEQELQDYKDIDGYEASKDS